MSGAGDANDDGYADVVVGAAYEDPGSSPEDAGRAYVFSGETGDTLYTLVSPNEEYLGYFSYSVSGAGDVNDDGYPDVIVGASRLSPWAVGPEGEGRAYIFSGPTGDLLHTLVSPNDTTGGFGNSVSAVGDVDDDSHADVIVGSLENPGAGEDAGRAYVFSWEVTPASDAGVVTPSLLTLRGPFPNPTDGSVRLAIQVLGSAPGHADLSLYGVSGRRIATVLVGTVQDAQSLTVSWTPHKKLSPGVYYWRLTAGAESVQRPMVLAK